MPAATASAAVPGGATQRFVLEQSIQADWWALFESPRLNALIEKAFAANPNVEAAQAALRAAQENVYAQRGFFFPTIQAGYTPSRTKLAGNLGGNSPGIQGNGSVISTFQGTPASEGGTAPFNGPVIYNFHTAQLTVGFVPDVFGANRRQVESLEAQAKAQQFQLEATRITLASNIVAAAIQDALLRQQIATTTAMIDANVAMVELASRQLKAGYASRLDLAVQENALAQARQLLPPLRKQFEQNRDLMRTLIGAVQDEEVPAFELGALRLPEELPLTLPSQLVEQRPDVRAAEALLQAASAEVGVARAARLPQFSIDATLGGAASHIGQMFWNSGKFFDLALGITQPLFAGGTLLHRERAATEALRQAAAQYRSTVITAFQNVADTLHAIQTDAEALQAAAEVTDTAKTALDLTQRQHQRGYLDRLALIGAQQTYRQAQLNLAQAQATRLGDTAALFQALGGGWWDRASNEPTVAQTTADRANP
ncbi:Outer membrane protein, tolC-like [Cupriavidus neocaledonicus]|uniref:Outer membrane protein, tolC-like n=2 Tax=Cupriavidus neocaledonicus TaxID=1040979 RepID=A0A375H3A7_9BURK|nr:Outer membrane protein, tolC-like [Cupriavidus neocaledonicus]SPD46734.1 Outer membrane protein, tolC-like [Cupriavidus neocaledonicus]